MDWHNKTEITSKNRPINSLLPIQSSFKRISKEIAIDEDSIDRLVKQRIRDKQFDNHDCAAENAGACDDNYVGEGVVDPNINLYELFDEISADLDKICCAFKPRCLVLDREVRKAAPKKKIEKKNKVLGILKKSKNVEILKDKS